MLQLTDEHLGEYISILTEADKAFVGNIKKDFIAQTQSDIFFQLGIRDRELMKYGLNAVAAAKGAYNVKMLDIIGKYQAGTYDFNKAFKYWKDATKIAMEATYRGGVATVGNPFYKDLKLPMRDKRLLIRYLNTEGKFFKGLLWDIKDPKHMPLSRIPRDAAGKILPGYRPQKFGYLERASMYPESMKAMRYNGAIMGAGRNIEIRWVLGVPRTEHCPDCLQLHMRMWTPKTLPTTPGAGQTECKHKCYCHLEFRQKVSRTTFDLAGSATSGAIMGAGRYSQVYDTAGMPIGGELQRQVESWSAQMNRARQMMSITGGKERLFWIRQRKEFNRLIIDRCAAGQYRSVPTVSVSALTKTIRSVYAKGGALVDDFMTLAVGSEVYLVRSDYSSFGVVGMHNGRLVFKSPTGVMLNFDPSMDIVFTGIKLPPGYREYRDATIVSEKPIGREERGIHETFKVKLSNGDEACYKPHSSSSACTNEVLAYEVAEAMGYKDLVPMTAMKGNRMGDGSVQRWVQGTTWSKTSFEVRRRVWLGERERLYSFDVIVGNADRHSGNFMVTKVKDKWILRAIDNEYTLGEGIAGWSNSWFHNEFVDTKISFSVKKALNKLIKTRKSIDNMFVKWGVDKRHKGFFWARVRRLLEIDEYDPGEFGGVRFKDLCREEGVELGW